MKIPFTLKELATKPCAHLNQHLINPAEKATNQQVKKKYSAKKSAAIRWLNKNLWAWCRDNELELKNEFEFAPGRKYASDYAIESWRLLIEYEGGIFMDKAGHNTATGIQRDIDKYELAASLGFTVIRLTAINYKTILQKLEEFQKVKRS